LARQVEAAQSSAEALRANAEQEQLARQQTEEQLVESMARVKQLERTVSDDRHRLMEGKLVSLVQKEELTLHKNLEAKAKEAADKEVNQVCLWMGVNQCSLSESTVVACRQHKRASWRQH
jgi:hypothetical protein